MLHSYSECLFLCLSEHWKSNEQLQMFKILDFELCSSFCRAEGSHGGTAVYGRSGIRCKNRLDLVNLSISFLLECAAGEFYIDEHKIILLCIYRPPGCNFEEFMNRFEQILLVLEPENCIILISGDFNVNIKENNTNSYQLTSLLGSYNLLPSINEYTRVTPTSKSCIDNIFLNLNDYQATVLMFHISDHYAQKLDFLLEETQNENIYTYKRFYNSNTILDFRCKLSEQNWRSLYAIATDDVNMQWKYFMNNFKLLFNETFPLKRVQLRNTKKPTYLNNGSLLEYKHELDALLVVSKFHADFKVIYEAKKKDYENLLGNLKKAYYSTQIQNAENKTKCVWNIINTLQNKKSLLVSIILEKIWMLRLMNSTVIF